MKIINKRLVLIGGSYHLLIPKAYIENKMIDPNKYYDFHITAIERKDMNGGEDEL